MLIFLLIQIITIIKNYKSLNILTDKSKLKATKICKVI
jgi:hypothetical protein